MSANVELKLIAKILDTGKLQEVLDAGITASHFSKGTEAHRAFKYVYEYWRNRNTMGNVPTREMIEEELPTITLPEENRLLINSCIDSMKQFSLKGVINTLQMEVEDSMFAEDTDAAIRLISKAAMELAVASHTSSDLDVAKDKLDIIDSYEESKFRTGLKGMPWPWEVLNEETGGILDTEFTILYGRPKSMKTWLMLRIAENVYTYANKRILIYTREMHPRVLRQRLVALIIMAPYKEFLKGKLDEVEAAEGGTIEDRFYDIISTIDIDEETCSKESGNNKGIIITSDRENRYGGGVMGLRQKVEQHKPDLILVDGVYLMRNDRDGKRSIKWDNITAITQDLHDVCLDYNRPLIGTTQANRDSEDRKGEASMRGMSFSDSFAQDCDLGINVIRKPGEDPKKAELALIVTGARESCMHGFAIHGEPAIDFSEVMVPDTLNGRGQLDGSNQPLMKPLVFLNRLDVINMFKEVEKQKEEEKQTNQGLFNARMTEAKKCSKQNDKRGDEEEPTPRKKFKPKTSRPSRGPKGRR